MKIKYSVKEYSKIIGKDVTISNIPTDKRDIFCNFLNTRGYKWPMNIGITLDETFLRAHTFCLTRKMELLYSPIGNPGKEYEKDGKFTYKEIFG